MIVQLFTNIKTGQVDYAVTTATGRYQMILPASQSTSSQIPKSSRRPIILVLTLLSASCLAAYDFVPKGHFGFDSPPVMLTGKFCPHPLHHTSNRNKPSVDICGKQINLNTTSGEWYTNGRVSYSGQCDILNGTAGIQTPVCQTAAFESGATYTDLFSCKTDDVCKDACV